MDDTESVESPRKKVRLHQPANGAMDDLVTMTEIPPAQADEAALQVDKETRCGITETIDSSLQTFEGVMKQRYTDFLVNEILPSGNVVYLDDFKAPQSRRAYSSTQPTPDVVLDASRTTEPQLTGDIPRVLPEPEPVNRKRHKTVVRETDNGIVEIDQDENIHDSSDTLKKVNPPDQRKEDPAPTKCKDGTSTSTTNAQQLTDSKKDPTPSTTSDWNAYAGKPGRFELSPQDKSTLTAYFEADIIEMVVALYNRILHSPNRRAKEHGSVKSAVIADRAVRTKIHQDLRRIFQSRLESMTDNDGAIAICAMAEKPRWGSNSTTKDGLARKSQQNKRPQWQELGGDFLHFTLYKENKDTMEAISWLSRQLKIPMKSFQFAGTKDRRAVTVQRVSVYRVLADRMIGAARTLKQAKIGNFKYQPNELRLGDLVGNEFVITLRNCRFQFDGIGAKMDRLNKVSAVLDKSVRNLHEKGFINYYGLQRFGTFSTRTDTIGVKMLQGNFEEAINAILDFNPASLEVSQNPTCGYDKIAADDSARASAIQTFRETGKSHSALEIIPRKFSAESSIIRHLGGKNQDNDYQGALSTIPRNLRLMYVHAYQSLVWNVMAGLRWVEYGAKVIEGDLVLISEHANQKNASVKPAEVDDDGEAVVQPDEEDRATNTDDLFERARAVTKEEADSRKYSIFDVVLPTPGYDILYPANEMAEHYKIFMASERGGGLDPQNMRRGWKDISLSGSYRKLIARPMSGVSYEIKTYTDNDEQFVQTDLDKLSRAVNPAHTHRSRPQASTGAKDGLEGTACDEKLEPKLAVILRLQLGSSQYATMALRELMGPGGLQTYKPDYGGGR